MTGPPEGFHGPPPPPPEGAPGPEPAALEQAQPLCPRCGAPHDPFQEYCLECGARLPRPGAARWSVWRRESWTRDSPFWFWAAFLGLLAIALVTAAVVVAATRDDEEPQEAAPPPQTTAPIGEATTMPLPETVQPPTATEIPTIATETTPTGPAPTFPTTGPTTTAPTVTTPPPSPTPPPPTPPPPTGATATWPPNRTAYTVIVGSFRESRGRAPAETRATQARNAGLDQVGIIRSSNFSSLRPGWYAVFTGIFDSRSQAESRLSTARSSGFPTAYLRHVRP